MQTYAVEARRTEGGPWMPVTTVQEDLLDFVTEQIVGVWGTSEFRVRPADSEPRQPVTPARKTVKVTPWDRLKWWAMFRFSRKASR